MLGTIYENRGDELPVSAFPIDGTFPTGPRNGKNEISRSKFLCGTPTSASSAASAPWSARTPSSASRCSTRKNSRSAPATFKSTEARDKEWAGLKYSIQVAPEDCTGCAICVDVCPVKNKQETRLKALNMAPQPPLRVPERDNWDFFLNIPELDRRNIKVGNHPPAAGTGAAVRILRRMLRLRRNTLSQAALATLRRSRPIANATGCSSIYGGNLPTTPWAKNSDGRGPAWSNSLFEDNAEFGSRLPSLSRQANPVCPRTASSASTATSAMNSSTAVLNASSKRRSRHLRATTARRANQRQTEKRQYARSQTATRSLPICW